jgi:hypothetical protein
MSASPLILRNPLRLYLDADRSTQPRTGAAVRPKELA